MEQFDIPDAEDPAWDMITDKFTIARAPGDSKIEIIENLQAVRERRVIINWLSPVDYASQQDAFIAKRQEGTGIWLLHSSEFQEWVNKKQSDVTLSGLPGAGKTILTSIVIDHICSKFGDNASVDIAYLYCNFRRQFGQRPADLLASLLRQLVQKRPSIPDSLNGLNERHNYSDTRPSLDEISDVLHSVVSDFSRTFIIVDALDECQVSDGCRTSFMSEMLNLQMKTEVNLFATSRFIPDIEDAFQGCLSLKIHASREDVRRYLDGHISRLSPCVSESHVLQEEITAEIIKTVDGMYTYPFLIE